MAEGEDEPDEPVARAPASKPRVHDSQEELTSPLDNFSPVVISRGGAKSGLLSPDERART